MEEGAAAVGSFCVPYNQDGVILVRKGLEAMCVSSQGTFSNIDSAEAEVEASEAAWWHRTKWGKRPLPTARRRFSKHEKAICKTDLTITKRGQLLSYFLPFFLMFTYLVSL